MYSRITEGYVTHAKTKYKINQQNESFSLVDVELRTGKKNQIRVHMKDLGHPVAGDKKYGANTNPINRLGLHAKSLSFIHPTTGKLQSFTSPVPRVFWQKSAQN